MNVHVQRVCMPYMYVMRLFQFIFDISRKGSGIWGVCPIFILFFSELFTSLSSHHTHTHPPPHQQYWFVENHGNKNSVKSCKFLTSHQMRWSDNRILHYSTSAAVAAHRGRAPTTTTTNRELFVTRLAQMRLCQKCLFKTNGREIKRSEQ